MTTDLTIPEGSRLTATLPDVLYEPWQYECRPTGVTGEWVVRIGEIEFYTDEPDRIAEITRRNQVALDEAEFGDTARSRGWLA
jgi:hypothetical protein